MKIRIKGNSLRLRLTQSEVQDFEKVGFVKESIRFGLKETEQLSYLLIKSATAEIEAQFSDNQITVAVPQEQGVNWASTNLVGMSKEIVIGNGENLSILIEKDFKCLTERTGEDESDNFPNPLEKHPNC